MNSTDYNLNNPFKQVELDLQPQVSRWLCPTVCGVKQQEYDDMKSHDQTIVYAITDSPEHKIYLGDVDITPDYSHVKAVEYFMHYNPNKQEYMIVMCRSLQKNDRLFSILPNDFEVIASYKDPQAALDALISYSNKGFHGTLADKLYECFKGFITKANNTNQTILSMITAFGYGDTPEFQELIKTTKLYDADMYYGADKKKDELHKNFLELLRPLRDQTSNILYTLYDKIYSVFVKYNFFRDKRFSFDDHDPDLSDPMNDVLQVFLFGMK